MHWVADRLSPMNTVCLLFQGYKLTYCMSHTCMFTTILLILYCTIMKENVQFFFFGGSYCVVRMLFAYEKDSIIMFLSSSFHLAYRKFKTRLYYVTILCCK